jgi:hypothetical protein
MRLVAHRRDAKALSGAAEQALLTHDALDASLAHADVLVAELFSNARTSVGPATFRMDDAHVLRELTVGASPVALGPLSPGVVALPRDAENAAQRKNGEIGLLRVDEREF